jgi:serine/threonine protein kinase
MKSERWQQIEECFHIALALGGEARAAYLKTLDAEDSALRREVERLIAAEERADAFLVKPAMEVMAREVAATVKRSLIGRSLGHFSIQSLLGKGGMGEVYKTYDTKLDRIVALKILPPEIATDRGRMRRFLREAKAAAALNHPNIATVYETGEADGLCFIVMEYVEGQTLRQRMKREPLPILEVLDVAIQTASALAATHKADIVHRDIKPENIMLRPDGYVKILDFGLAKLTQANQSEAFDSATDSSTLAGTSTPLGLVMGTPGYMSPEQACGREVDSRSDIFSLGAALYALIAGQSPFASPTPAETIGAILHYEPPGLTTCRPDIPPEFEQIVARALRKRPEDRYQSAAELAQELQALKQRMQSSKTFADSQPGFLGRRTPAVKPLRTVWRRRNKMVALAVLALVLVTATGYLVFRQWNRQAPDKGILKRPAFLTVEPLVGPAGNVSRAAISPDGRYIAYAEEQSGKQRLMLKDLSSDSPQNLVEPDEVNYDGITFSVDGQYIYYTQRRDNRLTGVLNRVHRVELFKKELPVKGIDTEVTFSPDGKRIAFGRGTEGESCLIVANQDGSEETTLATHKLTDYFCLKGLSWSPDGTKIACSCGSDENLVSVVLVDVSAGTETVIDGTRWQNINGMAWLDQDRGLIVAATAKGAANSQLFYLPYPQGEVQQLTADTNEYSGVTLTKKADRLLTTIIPAKSYSTIWVGTAEGEIKSTLMTEPYNDMSWTPDGRIIASQADKDGLNLIMMDAHGENRRQLTFGPGDRSRGRVTQDGRYVVYVSREKGSYNIWRLDLNDLSTVQLTYGEGEYAPSLTPDGQWVFYWSDTKDLRTHQDKRRVWRVALSGGEAKPFIEEHSWKPAVSPNGEYVACYYLDKKANREKAAVIPITGGKPIHMFDVPEKSIVRWLPDSKALSYYDTGDGSTNLWMQSLDGTPPKQLRHFGASSERARIRFFDWATDGSKQLALLRESPLSLMVLRRD